MLICSGVGLILRALDVRVCSLILIRDDCELEVGVGHGVAQLLRWRLCRVCLRMRCAVSVLLN